MSFPEEVVLQDQPDVIHLRRAIELSLIARQKGNRPFGAIIIDADGKTVLAEGYNCSGETGDCTAHAEMTAIRKASPCHSREVLSQATLYSSGKCTGHYNLGISAFHVL